MTERRGGQLGALSINPGGRVQEGQCEGRQISFWDLAHLIPL